MIKKLSGEGLAGVVNSIFQLAVIGPQVLFTKLWFWLVDIWRANREDQPILAILVWILCVITAGLMWWQSKDLWQDAGTMRTTYRSIAPVLCIIPGMLYAIYIWWLRRK